MLGEIINLKIPFITIPLPSSADNHQLKNAEFYSKKGFGYFIEEKNIRYKLYDLIKLIFTNKSATNRMLSSQEQHSDKEIFKNLNTQIEKILNEKINLGQKDIIHFVGIGGIGMSGLAQIMKNMGFKVQGSDQSRNKNTISCLRLGIKIFIGHSSLNVQKQIFLLSQLLSGK